MTGIFGQAKSQLGGLGKHVAKRVVKAPFEILKDDASGKKGEGGDQGMQALEQGAQVAQQQQGQPQNDFGGFATKQHFKKYSELGKKKDEIELRQIRRQLHGQFGLQTNLEGGMQKARMERQQRMEQEEKVEEQEQEQEKVMFEEKKKEESIQVRSAKGQTGAETRVGKKIAG